MFKWRNWVDVEVIVEFNVLSCIIVSRSYDNDDYVNNYEFSSEVLWMCNKYWCINVWNFVFWM